MPNAHVIELRADCDAAFPSRCVVCMAAAAKAATVSHDTMLALVRRRGLVTEILGSGQVHVPLCGRCGWKFRVQRLIGSWAWPAALVVLFFATGAFALTSAQRGWVVMAMIALALLPSILFTFVFVPYFVSSTSRDSIEYTFGNLRYAKLFRRINRRGAV